MINISAEGARLSGLGGLTPGETLRLEPGTACPPLEAEVRWVRGTLAGLRFSRDLAPRQVAMIRRSIATSPGHRPGGWNLQLRELR